MTTIESTSQVIAQIEAPFTLHEDQLAAVAFLARYQGRTVEAYRHDLRDLFQWAAEHDLAVLDATRVHLELYWTSMEERGLAPRPSTGGCLPPAGSTDSLTLTGASPRTPPSTSAAPPSTPPSGRVSTAANWPVFC